MRRAAAAAPVDRPTLEKVIQRALASVAANSSYGSLTLATLNRARRDIMHAAEGYRLWQDPPTAAAPERPTPTQQITAAERRAKLSLVRGDPKGRSGHLPTERPSHA